MTFQYREFTKTNQKRLKQFDQLDIYFYKAKSTGLGIKARFAGDRQIPITWKIKEIQVKLIKNYGDIAGKTTMFEKWKKVRIPVQFTVYSLKYFLEHHTSQKENIEELVQQHLKGVCKNINNAILHCQQIKEKHMKENPDLNDWVKSHQNLEEIYAVQKSRDKSFTRQEGLVSAIPLFKKVDIENQPIYKTNAYQQKSEEKLKKVLNKNLVNVTENMSYPAFLQKKHFGIL